MDYLTVKTTGQAFPRLGFGGMRFPLLDRRDEASINKAEVQSMVDLAMKNGVNYFDTAYMYHKSLSEGTFREALSKYPRESYILADKMPFWAMNEESDVERVFNEQLKRCGVDYFDVYLLHAMSEELYSKAESLNACDFLFEQKKRGKIRALGFSYHGTTEFFDKLCDLRPWDVVQIQFNYLDYSLENASLLINKIEEKGLACIVMEPLRGGLLASLPKAVRDEVMRENPLHTNDVALALNWLLDKKYVTTVLSGMSTIGQMEENISLVNSFNGLSEEERRSALAGAAALEKLMAVRCTGCGYCMDCPFGVDIPASLAAFGRHALSGDDGALLEFLRDAEKSSCSPSLCTSCGECTGHCPQKIDVPAFMDKLKGFSA